MNRLPLLEYDIISHCNLNCRNCSHFSPFKQKKEKSVGEISSDIEKLCRKFEIDRFKLAGGEPLLHSDVCRVLSVVRGFMKRNTIIVLATNGLKINSMKKSFFMTLRYLKIELHVTKYPINVDYNNIEKRLQLNGIQYEFITKTEFNNFVDPQGSQDGVDSFSKCQSRRCPFYDGEYIYSCAYSANVPFINNLFGYHIECNRISINESPEVISNYIFSPSSTCKFCNVTRPPEPWRLNTASDTK